MQNERTFPLPLTLSLSKRSCHQGFAVERARLGVPVVYLFWEPYRQNAGPEISGLDVANKLQNVSHRGSEGVVVKCVLDTNVVLDWLVFQDPATHELERRVGEDALQVATCALIIDELRRVLAYPRLQLVPEKQTAILARYESQTSAVSMPQDFSRDNLSLPASFPHCRDRDDDLFLAFTYHANADALLTRDKQVLALKRRAAKFGVNIADIHQLADLIQSAV